MSQTNLRKRIKEILEKMDNFTEDEAVKYLKPLINMLSNLSTNTIAKFQNEWVSHDKNNKLIPFKKFVTERNKVIKECINLELSETGKMVRKLSNLKPITLETEIKS